METWRLVFRYRSLKGLIFGMSNVVEPHSSTSTSTYLTHISTYPPACLPAKPQLPNKDMRRAAEKRFVRARPNLIEWIFAYCHVSQTLLCGKACDVTADEKKVQIEKRFELTSDYIESCLATQVATVVVVVEVVLAPVTGQYLGGQNKSRQKPSLVNHLDPPSPRKEIKRSRL